MILDKIVVSTAKRVAHSKEFIAPEKMKQKAEKCEINRDFPFKKALSKKKLSFICEVKKASPSKSIISEDFPYIEIAENYEKYGADAVSVLTEPEFFKGDNRYLTEISEKIKLPLLRKDFIIDEYQIYEAKVIGASAVLLICSILNEKRLSEYLKLAHSLGLSALVEAHNEDEVQKALASDAEIIGVNNRNLNDFSVDLKTSEKLRKHIPDDKIFVSESGIHTAEDIKAVREYGADAVLIGEAFMKSDNIAELFKTFRGMI